MKAPEVSGCRDRISNPRPLCAQAVAGHSRDSAGDGGGRGWALGLLENQQISMSEKRECGPLHITPLGKSVARTL